jgi:Ca2+-binding RTX toxin-like protein
MLTDFEAGDMIKIGAAADGVPKKLTSEAVDAILDNESHTSAGYEYEYKGVTFITPIALTESSFYADRAPVGGGSMNSVILTDERDVWPEGGDVNSEADHIRAKGGNDEIYAGMGDDLVDAGAGNDEIYGGSGDDTVHGGTGNDDLSGDALDGEVPEIANEPGNDEMYGGAGNDMMSGNEGHDELHGGTGNDTMNGNDGRDHLEGDDGVDGLYGGLGRDLLDGGAGNDMLFGGGGNDEIRATKGDTVDGDGVEMSGGADTNDDGTDDTVSYMDTDAGVTVDLEESTAPDDHEDVINVEHFIGSEKGDHVDGGAAANELKGGGGNDTLSGAAGNDMLDGGAGNDMLAGDDGIDTVKGGAGDDTISGGAAVMIVADQIDTIASESDGEGDVLTGGAGSDTFTWGDGDVVTDYSRGDKIDHVSVDQSPASGVVPSFTMVDHDNDDSTPNALQVTVGSEVMYFEGLDMSDTDDLVWT